MFPNEAFLISDAFNELVMSSYVSLRGQQGREQQEAQPTTGFIFTGPFKIKLCFQRGKNKQTDINNKSTNVVLLYVVFIFIRSISLFYSDRGLFLSLVDGFR